MMSADEIMALVGYIKVGPGTWRKPGRALSELESENAKLRAELDELRIHLRPTTPFRKHR